MSKLTQTQADVLHYIKFYIKDKSMSPTRTEISESFGWKSDNAAQCHITALVKKGAITTVKGSGRSIVPIKGFKVEVEQGQ